MLKKNIHLLYKACLPRISIRMNCDKKNVVNGNRKILIRHSASITYTILYAF